MKSKTTTNGRIWSINLDDHVPFFIFENEAASRGYRAKDRRPDRNITHNGFTIKTNNGVDCEIKVVTKPAGLKVVYIAGFKGAAEKTQILRKEIESIGMKVIHGPPENNSYLFIEPSPNFMDGFWELVDCVENINQILRNPGGSRSIIPVQPQNFAMAIAENIMTVHRWGMPSGLSRAIFDDIHVKKLRIKGYSLGGRKQLLTRNPYCEHITPCDWMNRTGIDMCRNGATVNDIANMIERNFWIAYISDEEANLLNHTWKWKTIMPPGWKDGDDPMDRLTKAGIIIV